MSNREVLAKPSPEEILARCFVEGPSRAIEGTEERGVAALRESNLLPIEVRRGARADLEAMGIVFGEPADELFIEATLPVGWRLVPGENAHYWTKLVDDNGETRANIFYKAAWYDREAFIRLAVP